MEAMLAFDHKVLSNEAVSCVQHRAGLQDASSLTGRIRKRACRHGRDDSGNYDIIVVLVLRMLLGCAALGTGLSAPASATTVVYGYPDHGTVIMAKNLMMAASKHKAPASTPTPTPTPTPTGFDFTTNFDNIPAGTRFTLDVQQQVFNSPAIVNQTNGDTGTDPMFTIVSTIGPGGRSGNALQVKFPQGCVGGAVGVPGYGSSSMNFTLIDADVINIEYDVYFLPGFDLHFAGKIGPAVFYSVDGTPAATSGLKTIWRVANDPIGHELGMYYYASYGTPVTQTYSVWWFNTGQWYHFKQQLARGPSGWGKIWIGGTLYYSINPTNMTSTEYPSFQITQWFGGSGSTSAALNDSYILYDNIRVWSGTGP
jgi:hypothetical protein